MINTIKHTTLAIVATLLLALPSALGVQRALAPMRGDIAAWSAAIGFELLYLSTAVLSLDTSLRRYARNVALSAVASAVLLNTLADYSARVAFGLVSSSEFVARFDALAAILSFLESLPLAGLAFAMSTLLHRISELEHLQQSARPPSELESSLGLEASDRYEQLTDNMLVLATANAARYECPKCACELASKQAFGSAKRLGYCSKCR